MKHLPLWDQHVIKLLREVSPGAAHTCLHGRGSLLACVGLSAPHTQRQEKHTTQKQWFREQQWNSETKGQDLAPQKWL